MSYKAEAQRCRGERTVTGPSNPESQEESVSDRVVDPRSCKAEAQRCRGERTSLDP